MASVDILLPYWGDVSLLQEAVDSVMAQSFTNWRLVIIDDHYPSDEAKQLFSQHADKRITYIRHKNNIGITQNFNFCIDIATAEYCMILGCDDRLLPDYLEIALKNIADADMYQPRVEVIDANGRSYLPLGDRVKRLLQPKKSGIYEGEALATSLSHGNWLYFPSILWKTSTLQQYRFDEKYKIVEDVALEFSMIIDGAKLFFDTATTFQYRRFAESLSSKEKHKNGIRFHEEATAYRDFSEQFRRKGWPKAARAAEYHITSRINQLLTSFSR